MDARTQAVIDIVIANRIALLTKTITEGREYAAEVAAIHLAKIGTLEASNALMELITQARDEDMRDTLTDTLVSFSPLRDNYKDQLSQIYNAQDLAALYVASREQREVTDARPLWQEITEALKLDFAQQLKEAGLGNNAGILLAD